MQQESTQSVLHRLLHSAGVAATSEAVTPARALRLAMARSAEVSIGLNLTVSSVQETTLELDQVLADLADDAMLLRILRSGNPVGLVSLDLQMRTAVVESQTIGTLRDKEASARPITPSDAALGQPLVSAFLADLASTSAETPLEGWADGCAAGPRFETARAAGMALEDRALRLVRMEVDLGPAGRKGTFAVALPAGPEARVAKKPAPEQGFAEQLKKAVMAAPAHLHAVLDRIELPLSDLQGLSVGEVLPLPGITVSSVVLEGRDGVAVGRGRLGQVTGLRAVRLEEALAQDLIETRFGHDAPVPESMTTLDEIAFEPPGLAVEEEPLMGADAPDEADHAAPVGEVTEP